MYSCQCHLSTYQFCVIRQTDPPASSNKHFRRIMIGQVYQRQLQDRVMEGEGINDIYKKEAGLIKIIISGFSFNIDVLAEHVLQSNPLALINPFDNLQSPLTVNLAYIFIRLCLCLIKVN